MPNRERLCPSEREESRARSDTCWQRRSTPARLESALFRLLRNANCLNGDKCQTRPKGKEPPRNSCRCEAVPPPWRQAEPRQGLELNTPQLPPAPGPEPPAPPGPARRWRCRAGTLRAARGSRGMLPASRDRGRAERRMSSPSAFLTEKTKRLAAQQLQGAAGSCVSAAGALAANQRLGLRAFLPFPSFSWVHPLFRQPKDGKENNLWDRDDSWLVMATDSSPSQLSRAVFLSK